MLIRDIRRVAVEVVHRDVVRLEQQRQPGLEPRGDQILDHLRLPVDDDRPAAGELAHRHVVPLGLELEMDAVVDDALAVEALGDSAAVEQVDGALLQHAGADARLDVVAAPVLEHDRLDTGAVQQLRERQSGRACADDRDLCARAAHASSSTCCAIANARFAAGTPQ